MDSGYYAAMTGLVARSQALDIAATNLANAGTPGYRAEKEYFSSVLLGPDAADSQLGQAVNNYGLLGGDQLSMIQGTIDQTGNPLDLAIAGEGFFQVQTTSGPRYTRNGSFHRTPAGLLVTASGDPVLSASGKPIPIPPGEVSIGADGSVSVDGGVVATVGVFAFPKGVQLSAEGADRYVAPEGATPKLSKDAVLHQGALETANENATAGAMSLVVIQREAEMMQKVLTIFHTEFNKIASEDLPKV